MTEPRVVLVIKSAPEDYDYAVYAARRFLAQPKTVKDVIVSCNGGKKNFYVERGADSIIVRSVRRDLGNQPAPNEGE
jgi:hypothetical protein